jgi:hypothetical protein
MSLWQDVIDLLSAPFAGPLDLEDLFLITGVVIIFIAVWMMILYSVRQAAAEL